MKPLLFKPVYVERIWGGRDLENIEMICQKV